jgi:hypothetical protein
VKITKFAYAEWAFEIKLFFYLLTNRMQEAVTNNLYGINTVDLLIIVQATESVKWLHDQKP